MIDFNRSTSSEEFDVTIGHQRVRVLGVSRESAIEAARRQLCHDLPRLYDVISQLDDSRFVVQVVR